MIEAPVLEELGLVIGGAALLLFVARALRLPSILAYLVAGLLLGPALGLLTISHSVEVFSELGVSLLLFLVGLELSVERVRDVGGSAAIVGTLQVAATTAGGAALGWALGFRGAEPILLGLATAFSSTVVAVKLLDQEGALEALHGRLSIGILLVQDVLVAVALTLVGGLATGAGSLLSVGAGLLRASLGIALLGLLAWAASRRGLGDLFRWFDASSEGRFVLSLAWCFGFIAAAAALGLSVELGAFMAGVGLAQLPTSRELARRVHPLVELFLAIFFVTLGAGIDPASALRFPVAILALGGFVLIVKPALLVGLLRARGVPARARFRVGLVLGQVSEFAFILTGLAVAAGLVRPALLSLLGAVGILTIGASAVLAPHADAVRSWWTRTGQPDVSGDDGAPHRVGHVIVVGMNALGRRIVHGLAARGYEVLAVDVDPAKLTGLPVGTLIGDVDRPSVLEEAGLERALLLVSALQIEDVNALLAHRCAEAGVPCSLHAFDTSVVHELLEIGADHLIASKHESTRSVAEALRARGVAC